MPDVRRVAIFVDGSNLNQSQGRYNQGYKVDLVRLVELLFRDRQPGVVHYYGSERGSRQTRFAKLRNLYRFQLHQQRDEIAVDLALALDMLDGAWRNSYDVAVLISGDKHFAMVVEKVKRVDKLVEVAAFANSLSDELKKVASEFQLLDWHAQVIRLG